MQIHREIADLFPDAKDDELYYASICAILFSDPMWIFTSLCVPRPGHLKQGMVFQKVFQFDRPFFGLHLLPCFQRFGETSQLVTDQGWMPRANRVHAALKGGGTPNHRGR